MRQQSDASRVAAATGAPAAAAAPDGLGELRQIGDAAEDDRKDAGLLHQRCHLDGARRDDDAAHLLADALR